MTRDELWKIYCDKNPEFANPDAEIRMSARGLKKLFEQTCDQSEKRAADLAKSRESLNKATGGMFGNIFGL